METQFCLQRIDFVQVKLWQDLSSGNKKVSIYIQNLFLHDIQSFQTKIGPNQCPSRHCCHHFK